MLVHKNGVYKCLLTIKLLLQLSLSIWSMYGVLRATCGSNPLGVDDENDFPNALNKNLISEWNYGKYKLNQQELICITIQLLLSDITPLNQMQKD